MRFLLLLLLPLFLCSACADLKTRYAGDPAFSCGRTLAPGEYCSNFESTSALKADPNSERVRAHCLDFYREAIRSTALLCSYFEELDSLSQWGEGDESPTLAAKGKRIHRKYSRLAAERAGELERAYSIAGGRGVKGAVEELAYDGKTNLRKELECDGVPGAAPGLLLLGVAVQARNDQRKTFERLKKSLTLLAGATSLALERPFLAIRTAFGVEKGRDGYVHSLDNIQAMHLDEPALLALGKTQLESTPALETYYAESMQRATAKPDAPATVRAVSTGRALASVRCNR